MEIERIFFRFYNGQNNKKNKTLNIKIKFICPSNAFFENLQVKWVFKIHIDLITTLVENIKRENEWIFNNWKKVVKTQSGKELKWKMTNQKMNEFSTTGERQ